MDKELEGRLIVYRHQVEWAWQNFEDILALEDPADRFRALQGFPEDISGSIRTAARIGMADAIYEMREIKKMSLSQIAEQIHASKQYIHQLTYLEGTRYERRAK